MRHFAQPGRTIVEYPTWVCLCGVRSIDEQSGLDVHWKREHCGNTDHPQINLLWYSSTLNRCSFGMANHCLVSNIRRDLRNSADNIRLFNNFFTLARMTILFVVLSVRGYMSSTTSPSKCILCCYQRARCLVRMTKEKNLQVNHR